MEAIVQTSDVSVAINILNIERARDIPAGASIELASLIDGNVIQQATPLAAPATGVRKVCKQAICLTGSTTTVKNVTTGTHNFKVGDILCNVEGGVAYAITGIVTTSGVDAITVGTSIGANAAGSFIYEAAATSASTTSAFKNKPVCIAGKAFKVDQSKVVEAIPAYVGASVVSGVIAPLYLAYMKNIDAIAY